jgi:hypothetical protein
VAQLPAAAEKHGLRPFFEAVVDMGEGEFVRRDDGKLMLRLFAPPVEEFFLLGQRGLTRILKVRSV